MENQESTSEQWWTDGDVYSQARERKGFLKPVSGKTFLILLKAEKPMLHNLFYIFSSKYPRYNLQQRMPFLILLDQTKLDNKIEKVKFHWTPCNCSYPFSTFIMCFFLYMYTTTLKCISQLMFILDSTVLAWGEWNRIVTNFSLRWNVLGKTLNVHICTLTFKVSYWEPESRKIWEEHRPNRA